MELSYKPLSPYHIKLEDNGMCLQHMDDPFLSMEYRTADINDYSEDEELCELKEAQLSLEHLMPLSPQSDANDGRIEIRPRPIDPKTIAEAIYKRAIPPNCTAAVNIHLRKAETWIRETFEIQPHTSVARRDIYDFYQEHCKRQRINPCNCATFGKVLRIVFPDIRTRRIGNRGKSRYHYYGIGPRNEQDSPLVLIKTDRNKRSFAYEHFVDSCNNESEAPPKEIIQLCQDEIDILKMLDHFPTCSNVNLPDCIEQRMTEFLYIYKQHIVYILKYVLKAEFIQVKTLIVDFWTKLPVRFLKDSLITREETIGLIASCDGCMYQCMKDILIPDSTQSLPAGLVQYIKEFIDDLDMWVEEGLSMYPRSIKDAKLTVCKRFQRKIRQHIHMCHLFGSCQAILGSDDTVRGMLNDFQEIDVPQLAAHCSSVCDRITTEAETEIRHYLGVFQQLLINNSALEEYIYWIDNILQDIVTETRYGCTSNVQEILTSLVLQWSYISGRIIQQLSMSMAQSLGSFHLLDVFFKDYVTYKVEEMSTQS